MFAAESGLSGMQSFRFCFDDMSVVHQICVSEGTAAAAGSGTDSH